MGRTSACNEIASQRTGRKNNFNYRGKIELLLIIENSLYVKIKVNKNLIKIISARYVTDMELIIIILKNCYLRSIKNAITP